MTPQRRDSTHARDHARSLMTLVEAENEPVVGFYNAMKLTVIGLGAIFAAYAAGVAVVGYWG